VRWSYQSLSAPRAETADDKNVASKAESSSNQLTLINVNYPSLKKVLRVVLGTAPIGLQHGCKQRVSSKDLMPMGNRPPVAVFDA